MIEILLLLIIFLGWIYWLVAWWMVCDFFKVPQEGNPNFLPPISILKAVKGIDIQALKNFASFCRQDYPDFEILFGVSDPADPVIPIVRSLQHQFPQRSIRLFIAPPIGSNDKAGILHHLAAQARHEILVISDSDMRVTPEYLRRVTAPLADPGIGLATCFYRGGRPLTLAACLEALHMAVTFLPSVVIGRRAISMRFAMGASVSVRRRDLNRLGGFAAFADYLADDFQLGSRIAGLGLRVHLSDYIVVNILGATSFLDQWDREVRWIRCARVSRPHEYPALIFSFSTPLAVAYAILSGFSFQGLWVLAASFALRWLVAWRVTVYTGDREVRRWLAWLPVRDVLSFLVWCAGSVGRRTIWRGEEYLLQPDGKMHPIQPATDQSTARRVVWGFSNRIGGAVHKSVDYVGQTISAALARIR